MKTVEEFMHRLRYVQSLHADFPAEAVFILKGFQHMAHLFEGSTDAILADSGLNNTSWSVLMMMYSNPEQSMYPSDLSDICTQSRPQMTRISDELVNHGWVVRQPDAVDRRKISLHLTADGVKLIQALLPKLTTFYAHLLSPLSKDEQGLLYDLLSKIGQAQQLAQNNCTMELRG